MKEIDIKTKKDESQGHFKLKATVFAYLLNKGVQKEDIEVEKRIKFKGRLFIADIFNKKNKEIYECLTHFTFGFYLLENKEILHYPRLSLVTFEDQLKSMVFHISQPNSILEKFAKEDRILLVDNSFSVKSVKLFFTEKILEEQKMKVITINVSGDTVVFRPLVAKHKHRPPFKGTSVSNKSSRTILTFLEGIQKASMPQIAKETNLDWIELQRILIKMEEKKLIKSNTEDNSLYYELIN